MGNKTKVIPHSFFARDTLTVAEGLLGKTLVRQRVGEVIRLEINEVEAYVSKKDLACHASRGRTKRTEVMFGEPATLYVYLIYGMYWMLNIVTESEGHPAAVLVRGVGEYDGPGKLTRALSITGELNGKMLGEEVGLWVEEGREIRGSEVLRTPRIGIDYAGEWRDKPFRFVLQK